MTIDYLLNKKNNICFLKQIFSSFLFFLFIFSIFYFINDNIIHFFISSLLLIITYIFVKNTFFDEKLINYKIDFFIDSIICLTHIEKLENCIETLILNNLTHKYFENIRVLFSEEDIFYFIIGYDTIYPNIKNFIINHSYTKISKEEFLLHKIDIFIRLKYNSNSFKYILSYLEKNIPDSIYITQLKNIMDINNDSL